MSTLEVVNARKLQIISEGILIYQDQMVSSGGLEIAGLNSSFGFEINGKRVSYLISDININSANSVSLISGLRNRSSMFLTPLVGLKSEEIGYNSFLYNTYLDTNTNLLNLVYRYFPLTEYRELEDTLTKNKRFVSIKDTNVSLNVPALVIVKMALDNPLYEKDVIAFYEGKYSLLSDIAKKKILNFHNVGKGSALYGILYKTPEYRAKLSESLGYDIKPDMELYDIPNMDEEILPIRLGGG